MRKNGTRGQRTYLKVRKMAKTGLNAEEISAKVRVPKHVVERYLRRKPGRSPTIPMGTRIRLPQRMQMMEEVRQDRRHKQIQR